MEEISLEGWNIMDNITSYYHTLSDMGGCGSSLAVGGPRQRQYRRAIKLYEVTEVSSMTNLLNRNKCFDTGESPLTLAAREGHEAVVEALLKGGADPNKLDKNGRGPLHIAVYMNDEETVDILLDNRANPNRCDDAGTTPLHVACERGYAHLLHRLLLAGGDANLARRGAEPPLMRALDGGHAECVELLLRHGADPDARDDRGSTALHLAIQNADASCVSTLLKFQANTSAQTRAGESALGLAVLQGNAEVVSALLRAGCSPDSCTEDDVPPVIAAAARGDADTLDILINGGADCEVEDKKNQTALQIVVQAAVEADRELFYCKYFSNLYRAHAKYDPLEIFPENCTRCTMSLVQGGARLPAVWERFSTVFPDTRGVDFEHMVLCEVLTQAYGFRELPPARVSAFLVRLISLREYPLVRLVYSAGVDVQADELYALSAHSETADRDMFRYVKRLRCSPRALRDLCRQRIRRALSPNVLYLVQSLTLPQDLKDYLCIMDTEHYSQVDV